MAGKKFDFKKILTCCITALDGADGGVEDEVFLQLGPLVCHLVQPASLRVQDSGG